MAGSRKVPLIERRVRTDFARAVDDDSRGLPEYAPSSARRAVSSVPTTAQPGRIRPRASVVLRVAAMDRGPLHLLLGSDAVETVGRSDTARMEADRSAGTGVSNRLCPGDPGVA